jgi:hypothetical protein
MTQNPYAQPPGIDAPVATRTSIAAILSLVCALACFVPGLGILAIILGIAAIFLIGSSAGRVTGRGLAISGILIGLLVTLAWGGAAMLANTAMNAFGKHLMAPVARLFESIEKQDYATARTLLNTPSGVPAPTDEQFDAFLAAYHNDVGAYKSMPTGFFDFITSFQKVQAFYKPTPGAPEMPIPTEFANGTGVILIEFPQGTNTASPNPTGLPLVNVGIMSSSKSTIWLLPKSGTTPVPNIPPIAPPNPPKPADGSTPAGGGN